MVPRSNIRTPKVEHSTKYILCAAAFYEDERVHQKAIEDMVDGAIGKLLFLRRHVGLGWDAVFQAALDYTKIVLQEKVRYTSYLPPRMPWLSLFTEQARQSETCSNRNF